MHSSIALLALAALVRAAPVAQKDAPDHYYEGYLEPYMTYHTRYITIGCAGQQGTQFFSDCCSPMLATETLEEARLPYCAPNVTESASATASATGSASASAIVQTESADYEAQSEYVHAIPSSTAEATSTWSEEAAPEPTQEAPKEESSNNNGGSPSGDVKTGGFATYFHQNGNAGACGQYHSDGEYGIAIDSNGYWGQDFSQGSDLCGRVINIKNTNNGKTVTATVWDVCPTCNNGNSLDLSVGAFNAIATEAEGMVPIEWSFA